MFFYVQLYFLFGIIVAMSYSIMVYMDLFFFHSILYNFII